MGWSYRRSAKFGPFRLNFSKSGIGVSAGVKGARISTGPRGSYANFGISGLYYRQKVGGANSAGSATRRVMPLTNTPINQYSHLNYPAFPKHGVPRIIKTLGILSVPALLGLYIWAVILMANSSHSGSAFETNDNSRSSVETAVNQSSHRRGLQAGSDYALRADGAAGRQNLNERRLKQLAAQMAALAKEDQEEWQLGWIEGYKRGIDSLNNPSANANKTLNDDRILQHAAPKTFVQAPNTGSNGYIRGPRGGCYYISGSGRRVYVDRGMCN